MAIQPRGNRSARKLHAMSDYGIRAAEAVNQLLPGPHRDKALQTIFDCSLRMAKYLRAGRYWTTDRLSQASRHFGCRFDELLSLPSPAQLHDRMDALEAEIAELRRDITDRGDNG